jgi:hypothetical protein
MSVVEHRLPGNTCNVEHRYTCTVVFYFNQITFRNCDILKLVILVKNFQFGLSLLAILPRYSAMNGMVHCTKSFMKFQTTTIRKQSLSKLHFMLLFP